MFIFGYTESSVLCMGFLRLWRLGAPLHWGAWTSHCGFSYCWAQALGSWVSSCSTQAQNLWFTGLVLLRHVGFSWIRDWIPVPCIGRQVLIHCNIREIQSFCFCCCCCLFVCFFVFEHLSTVGTSYKWNYVVFVLLWFFSLYFVYCLQGFINV